MINTSYPSKWGAGAENYEFKAVDAIKSCLRKGKRKEKERKERGGRTEEEGGQVGE